MPVGDSTETTGYATGWGARECAIIEGAAGASVTPRREDTLLGVPGLGRARGRSSAPELAVER